MIRFLSNVAYKPEIEVVLFSPSHGSLPKQKSRGGRMRVRIDLATAHLIPGEVAEELNCIPISQQGRVLMVGMARVNNLTTHRRLSELTGLRVRAVTATPREIRRAIAGIYA